MERESIPWNIEEIFWVIIIPSSGILGLILTLFSLIIFSNSVFKQEIYTFLKYESVFIAIDLFVTSFRPMFSYVQSEFSITYFSQLYYIYFIIIFTSIFEMSAIICHNLSNYELYILLSNKQKPKFLQKCPKKIICAIIFAFSCLIYLYQFFSFRVRAYGNYEINNFTNKTEFVFTNYRYGTFDFNDTLAKKLIQIIAFFLRDGVNLILLIGLNVMIFFTVKDVILKKKILLQNMATKDSSKKTNQIRNSQRTTAIMVLLVSLSYIIGRLPIMTITILMEFYRNDTIEFITIISVFCVYISYGSYFFIYYICNNKFRKIFNDYACFKFKNKYAE